MQRTVSIERVRQAVQEMKLFPEDSTFFRTAVLLIAGLVVGHNPKDLAEFTGYSERFIVKRVARLRQVGIWQNGETCEAWEDEHGGDAFFLDVLVAEGFVNCTWRPSGTGSKVSEF